VDALLTRRGIIKNLKASPCMVIGEARTFNMMDRLLDFILLDLKQVSPGQQGNSCMGSCSSPENRRELASTHLSTGS
jgi:hypothetical protein